MTIYMIISIEGSTRIMLGKNLHTINNYHCLISDCNQLVTYPIKTCPVMVTPKQQDSSMQLIEVLIILLDILIMWKHKVSTMDNNSIFRYNCIPVLDKCLIHLTPGLKWAVTVLANMKMTMVRVTTKEQLVWVFYIQCVHNNPLSLQYLQSGQ